MSAKSILIAWIRAALLLAGIVLSTLTIIVLTDRRLGPWLFSIMLTLADWALLVFTYRFKGITRANYQRACTLAKAIGLSDEGWAALENFYRQEGRGFPVQPTARRQPFMSEGLEQRGFH